MPAPARGEPPHREPRLGLMEVTTWVKRRQGDTRAVTQVKPKEPREKVPDADTLEYGEGQGKVAVLGKATGSPAGSQGTARVAREASEEPGSSRTVSAGAEYAHCMDHPEGSKCGAGRRLP